MLKTLQGVPSGMPNLPQELQAQLAQVRAMQSQQRGRQPEKNTFKFEDVIALANVAPHELDDSMLRSLAVMLRETLKKGNVIEQLIIRLQEETAKLALHSLNSHHKNIRDISTLSITLSKMGLQQLKEITREYRKSIVKVVNDDNKADQVYQVNIQIFPMSRKTV